MILRVQALVILDMEVKTLSFDFRDELAKESPKISEGAKIFIFGADDNWSRICEQYEALVKFDLNGVVDGFIDNDKSKQGMKFNGKRVYAFADIDANKALILISTASGRAVNDISAQLTNAGMIWRHNFFTTDIFFRILVRYGYLRMRAFKDRHANRRCFIVGNAPSLTAKDLDKLENEFTFGTNRIYLIFDKTKWRPSYYVAVDEQILDHYDAEIAHSIRCPIFYPYHVAGESVNNIDGYYFVADGRNDWLPNDAGLLFSDDAMCLHSGGTVTYQCIQLAAFMGFNPIILLGVDADYQLTIGSLGNVIRRNEDVQDHFSKDYIDRILYPPLVDIVDRAYRSARDYAEAKGVKIYNATRGGKLEVFERVDFDHLFRRRI
jgi:hypothetical protein